MKRRPVMGVYLFVVFLSACIFETLLLGGIDEIRYQQIAVGMTKRQVERLLGAPTYKGQLQTVSLEYGMMYSAIWSANGHRIEVLFNFDGIVIGKTWDGPSLYSTPQTVLPWR